MTDSDTTTAVTALYGEYSTVVVRSARIPDVIELLQGGVRLLDLGCGRGGPAVRLAERFGPAGAHGPAFPRAADLLGCATPGDLRALGLSSAKARTLLAVAEACVSGELDERALAALPDRDALARLTALWGIGRWSAEYTLLRGLGRLHVFPGDDVGAQRHLARWLNLTGQPGYAEAQAALQRWCDHAGLIYLHLLLQRLHDSGR